MGNSDKTYNKLQQRLWNNVYWFFFLLTFVYSNICLTIDNMSFSVCCLKINGRKLAPWVFNHLMYLCKKGFTVINKFHNETFSASPNTKLAKHQQC